MRRLQRPALVVLGNGKPARVSWSSVEGGREITSRSVGEVVSTPAGTTRTAPRRRDGGTTRPSVAVGGGITRRFGGSGVTRRSGGGIATRPTGGRVTRVIDEWRVAGRWWASEMRRDYYLLELDGGMLIELYREGEQWCVTGIAD